MGEVFKARDLALQRFVAIKILPRDRVLDPAWRERFFVEARAASALNHPNIVTIHEIGQHTGIDFLVMEYIAGKTLDQVLRHGPLPLKAVLAYTVQLADALSAAHSAGIVHRDIKPSNLIITSAGRVKVLDFGLAKSVEPQVASEDTTVAVDPHTAVNSLLGTPAYMSPEQAEGKPVDKRTDVFSMGAVLYEMIAGKSPFSGGSNAAVLAAVLTHEPRPLREIAPEIPVELDRLISRCLRKDPARRIQDMHDVKLTLEEIQAELDSSSPAVISGAKPKHRTRRGWWKASAAALTAFLLGGVWFWFKPFDHSSVLSPRQFTFDRGLTTTPAISPDGNLIAYASDRAGRGDLDIWVQYRAGNPVRITRDQADESEPSFSPDGTEIAFRSSRNGGGIYIASSLGSGEPRLVANGDFHRPLFSPDGVSLLFLNPHPAVRKAYLVKADDPGGSLREIAPGWNTYQAIWSPDGKQILFIGDKPGEFNTGGPFVVSKDGGPLQPVAAPDITAGEPGQVHLETLCQWLGDDRVLLEAGVDSDTQLWVSRLHRHPWRAEWGHPLTLGTGAARGASASREGSLVFSNQESESDIWSLPFDSRQLRVTGEARRLTQDTLDEEYPTISDDGRRLAFSISDASAMTAWKPWLMDMTTGQMQAATGTLTERGYRPVISPDGEQIAFTGNGTNTYVVPTNGGTIRKIASGSPVIWSWTADGRALFQLLPGPPVGFALIAVADGKQIGKLQRKHNVFQAHMSHDGHWLMAHEPGVGLLIAPVSGAGFPPEDQWRNLGLNDAVLIRWTPDDNAIVYTSTRDSFWCIYAQRLEPRTKRPVGSPFALEHFHQASRSLVTTDSGAVGLAVAKDKIVVAQVESTGNIWTAKLGR